MILEVTDSVHALASDQRPRKRDWRRRSGQALSELRTAPLLRALTYGGAVAATGHYLRRTREGAVIGVATAILERSLSRQIFALQRGVRNAADVATVAGHLGPDFPPLGTWAIEADFARLVVQELDRRPDVVVELGSGVSTLLVASVLSRRGFGRLVSVDHDHRFAAETGARLDRARVADRVSLIVAPLRPHTFGAVTTVWYDVPSVLDALPAGPIDLLVIDGPPSNVDWARWPAMEVLRSRLADGAVVLLDDGRQRRERAAALRWARDHHDLELYWVDTLKGTWRLQKRRRPPESAAVRVTRRAWRALNPQPGGFGRWPVRR
jgi:predicted O-methyltransferase YrrM